jgi:hypothetical protein
MQIFRVILAEVSSWIVLCTCVQSPSIWNHNFISRPLLSSTLSTIHDKIAPLEKHLTILLSTIQFKNSQGISTSEWKVINPTSTFSRRPPAPYFSTNHLKKMRTYCIYSTCVSLITIVQMVSSNFKIIFSYFCDEFIITFYYL